MKQVYGVVLSFFLLANAIHAEPMPVELRVNINNDRDLVRRQALGAPFYSPGGCCPGCPCCQNCMAPPPVPPPVPAFAPPPPMPVPAPVPAFPCGPACAPPPVPALAPLPPPPIPAVPAPAGRLIPQALPAVLSVECTGGSVCSMGICLCPPELVQEGTVCVSRTIYGVVPGAPPPPPPPGMSFYPYLQNPLPAAIPVAYPPAVPAPAAIPRPFFDPCIIKRSAEENAKFGCRNQQ